MRTNFKIKENYAIQFEGHHIDLHNNFDFNGVWDNNEKNEIALEFIKANGNWIKDEEFKQLTFLLKNVTFKYFEDGEAGDYPEDSKCLSDITFFPSEFRDINNNVTSEPIPKIDDDIIFLFQDGKIIRANCEEVEVIVKK